MARVSYPGVYVQEIPSGVHTIAGVSTSIAAFVDFFREGPMNKAVQIFGMSDFNRIYGGLDDRSEASYAISQFFLNGGSEAYVIRVAKDNTSGTPLTKATNRINDFGVNDIIEVSAISEGQWGNNIRFSIDHTTSDPTSLFNLYVTRYDAPGGKARPLVSEKYLNLSVDSVHVRYLEKVVNDQSSLIRVEHLASLSQGVPAATGTVSGSIDSTLINGLSGAPLAITISSSVLELEDAVAEATLYDWSNDNITVDTLAKLRPYLEKAIRTASVSQSGSYEDLLYGVTVELVGADRLRILAGQSGAIYDYTVTMAFADGLTGSVATNLELNTTSTQINIQEYQLGIEVAAGAETAGTVGADGERPGASELIGTNATEPHTGMYALDYVDLFNILAIPRVAELANDAELSLVYSKALKYCEDKRAFLIIDIPNGINIVQEVKDWVDAHSGLRSKNSAVYFPRLMIPDPMNEYRFRSVGGSGTMAGIYARTDNARGVWKAPSGTGAKLDGIGRLDTKLTDPQNGTLNPLAINCMRTFPIYGHVCWGARTLDGSDQAGSEWKYIPIRRLALFLEESLFRGTKWVVFEPNDEPLWAKIRLNINAFMMRLFRQGAFQGSSPDQAFYVKCDTETTTQADRNLGIVNIEVGFAPLKPAEFVVLKIQQMAGDL